MAVRYTVDLQGITAIVLTLIDVLSGLDQIKSATGYTRIGAESGLLPRRHGHAGGGAADL